ncbi:MAG: hypothetical protein PWQ41_1310 [Bacillota bacterium]|nr:hypothetical protein [Bacillota bacterium]MDK2856371.1 hypothetical protein [Bacillota bacterium]MDK2925536.1 hypothetical protein [Bacillota bacterium]
MELTAEERSWLSGEAGPILQKALETLVRYGEVFGARRLVPISSSHFVFPPGATSFPTIQEMLEGISAAGIKLKVPMTINPRPYEPGETSPAAEKLYGWREQAEKYLFDLGLTDSFTCTPYYGDNVPKEGEILGWAESSAVAYANSVIGARTNRNSAIIELCSALTGKTPEFGLLLDENRRGTVRVHLDLEEEPPYSLLGYLIGKKVGRKVPVLDQLPANESDLKDLGAAAAASGAVGLFHMLRVTPEARRLGEQVLADKYEELTITTQDLKNLEHELLKEKDPELIIIGCPHLSLSQLTRWAERLAGHKLAVNTWFITSPRVDREFRSTPLYRDLTATGAQIKHFCPLSYVQIPPNGSLRILTDSGKLCYYTRASYAPPEVCLAAMLGKGGTGR